MATPNKFTVSGSSVKNKPDIVEEETMSNKENEEMNKRDVRDFNLVEGRDKVLKKKR
jgi:hypothetical protein